MITVNAMGDACPIPVVKTKKAMDALTHAEEIETLVDNEIAVSNLTKLANQKGFPVRSEKLGEGRYHVIISAAAADGAAEAEADFQCEPCAGTKNTVVVISSDCMGEGDPVLGKTLLKGFIYALSQQEVLPKTMLFYNGGAKITCEDSPAIEDLKAMAAEGVEILTCGTCLNHYGLADKLQVGEVTNMYVIAEKMTSATLIVKP